MAKVARRTGRWRRSSGNDPLLSDYVDFVRRHRLVLVATLTAGLLAGVAAVVAKPDTYTSTVSVLTPAAPIHAVADSSGRLEEVTMDTEAQLLQSGNVLRRLAGDPHDTGDPGTLRERISLTVPPNTRVLIIQFEAPSPEGAKAGAGILAGSFLDYRQRLLAGRWERDLEALRERVAILQGQLESLSADGGGGGDNDGAAIGEDTASARRQTLVEQIEQLQQQLTLMEEPTAERGQVVRAPELPAGPDETNDEVALTSGLGLGLLSGIGLGLVRDRVPRRIRSDDDAARGTGLPVLAEARVEDASGRRDPQRIRTAYRRVHNLLTLEHVDSVLVTADDTNLAERVATTLAATSAHSGRPTTLLLASHTNAYPDNLGSVPMGGARARAGADPPPRTLPVRIETVLPEHLQDEQVVASIVKGASRDDGQLFIAGPSFQRADTLTIAAHTDIVVLVAERGRTRDRDIVAARRCLELAGATVRGVVLARPVRRNAHLERTTHA